MLLKKTFRDLWTHKGTYLASMTLVIVGILLYNMLSMIYEGFSYSLDKYYEEYNFADATIRVSAMPSNVIDEIINIKEINDGEGRLEKRVRLLDNEKEVIFQFMSYNENTVDRLNDIELLEGKMPNANEDEIIIGNNYFRATGMKIGDVLPVVVNGKVYNLKVVGCGRSPEFIYAKKNDNELISDPKGFDLVFMPSKSMNKMFGIKNEINNVAFTLYELSEFESAKTQIKDILYKYGIKDITPRKDLISHATTVQKMDGIGSVTKSLPIMFLLISGIIIYIVLKRVIEQERSQIGVLKAFGVSDFRILIHYISYSMFVGIFGGIIGAYIGIKSVPEIIKLLGVAFNMPFVTAGLVQKYLLNSFILSILFSVISGYAGAKKCINLQPAEAMRAPISKESKASILDKFYWIIEKYDIKVKMALRNIIRNKGRSIFILFGIIITTALLCFPVAMNDMYNKMLMDQFTKVETYDMKTSLNGYMDRKSIVREIENKNGVTVVEPMTQIPVEIFNRWKKTDSVIICIPAKSKLYHLYDSNGNTVTLQKNGMMLSHWMAKKLNIKEGDYVTLKSPLFKNDKAKKIQITKIIPQYIGSNGYMDIENVKDLLDGKDIVNALMINGTDIGLKNLFENYNESDRVATFDYSEKIALEFVQFMDQMTTTIGLLVFFGMITGFSVIYVSLTISLSERNRELATLLVLGMSEGEVHHVLIIEQFILSVFGIMLGLPSGKLLLSTFAESSSTEYLIMPSRIPPSAMVFSIIATSIAIIIPQIIGRKKISKIIVTEALNARE